MKYGIRKGNTLLDWYVHHRLTCDSRTFDVHEKKHRFVTQYYYQNTTSMSNRFFSRQRIISLIITVLILVAAIMVYNKLVSQKKERPSSNNDDVTNVILEPVEVRNTPVFIHANGTLLSKNRIDLFSRVQGIFQNSSRPFKPGVRFRKGELLVGLDNRDIYSNLRSARSQLFQSLVAMMADIKFDFPESYDHWNQYIKSFDIDRTTQTLPGTESDREKAFVNGRNIYPQYYSIKALEVTNGFYKIYAPFSGVLTEALINPGALISMGQKLGTFIDPNHYEMEIRISPKEADLISVGKKVVLHNVDHSKQWTGKISRINKMIDSQSQSLLALVEVQGKDLVEGLFLEAEIQTHELQDVAEIKRSILINEQFVFTCVDNRLSRKEVRPIHTAENTVFVKGLKAGDKVLAKNIPGAFDGMQVNPVE